jgi:ADP-ribose pyrophosphatase YjhB (NUDIX family)
LVRWDDKILIIERGQDPGKGKLSLPGGFIGEYEYLLDAAIRELKEETNIGVSNETLKVCFEKSFVFDDPYRDSRGRMVTHVHLFDLSLTYESILGHEVPMIEGGDDAMNAK